MYRYGKWLVTTIYVSMLKYLSRTTEDLTIKPVPERLQPHEQVVTPWDVQGGTSADGKQEVIDYDKLIDQFGTRRIDSALLERFKRLTGRPPHVFLRRSMFFSHRSVLEASKLGVRRGYLREYQRFWQDTGPIRAGKTVFPLHRSWTEQWQHASGPYDPICLYKVSNVERLKRFFQLYSRWLQDVFGCPLVIQLTGKILLICLVPFFDWFSRQTTRNSCSNTNLSQIRHENLQEKMQKTSSLVDSTLNGLLSSVTTTTWVECFMKMCRESLVRSVITRQKLLLGSMNRKLSLQIDQLTLIWRTLSDNIGKIHFTAIQAAPSFSNSFPHIFGTTSDIPCLIPCAIDQDPYFRLTRDVAVKLKYPKPALVHAKFFPALQGPQTKMSASDANSSIYMTDKPNQIKNKINRHGFSGGQETEEEHRRLGGNTEVDIAYQYLTFFLEDDEELERLGRVRSFFCNVSLHYTHIPHIESYL